MELDDELCLCFHVTKRKVINYLRIERPQRVGQLADCHGAGTGCGWCRPFLQKLFDAAHARRSRRPELPSPEEYAQRAQRLCPRRQRHAAAGRDADRCEVRPSRSLYVANICCNSPQPLTQLAAVRMTAERTPAANIHRRVR